MILDLAFERFLLWFSRSAETVAAEEGTLRDKHDVASSLDLLSGVYPEIRQRVANARVLDFGCGWGLQAVALAELGAEQVTGVDINTTWLDNARTLAAEHGVTDRVRFSAALGPEDKARFDLVISQNSMEHFPDPGAALQTMAEALAFEGDLVITFAPPWYAPYGAHMHFFTTIPWVHLFFPERIVMRVRQRYKHDGALQYEQIEGGLNRMSVRKFRRLLKSTGLSLVRFETEPVRGQRVMSRIPLIGEFFTNRVTAVLRYSKSRA